MIKLKEWQVKAVRKYEDRNLTNYEVVEVKGDYYIDEDNLFAIIDDIEENRIYAEEQLVALSERMNDDIPGLELSQQREIIKLKERIEELEETLDCAESRMNEDDYDRLIENGYNYFVEKAMGGN